MDGEGDLWDVDVLLEVEETHFQLIDLLLDRGHQFVTITVEFTKLFKHHMLNMCLPKASAIHTYMYPNR